MTSMSIPTTHSAGHNGAHPAAQVNPTPRQAIPSDTGDRGGLRSNVTLDATINRALAAALLIGVRAGMKIMVDEGVPPPLAARVLFSPQDRRATDWRQ